MRTVTDGAAVDDGWFVDDVTVAAVGGPIALRVELEGMAQQK